MNIRKAEIADVVRIAEIHVRSWQTAYKGTFPSAFLASLDLGQREVMWRSCVQNKERLFVAEDDHSEIVGFLCLGRPRDEDLKGATELTAIYLDPIYYGSGIGTFLWKEMEKKISTSTVYLWVLASNPIGIAFYEKNGFRADGKTKNFKIDGQEFEELRYQKLLHNRLVESTDTSSATH